MESSVWRRIIKPGKGKVFKDELVKITGDEENSERDKDYFTPGADKKRARAQNEQNPEEKRTRFQSRLTEYQPVRNGMFRGNPEKDLGFIEDLYSVMNFLDSDLVRQNMDMAILSGDFSAPRPCPLGRSKCNFVAPNPTEMSHHLKQHFYKQNPIVSIFPSILCIGDELTIRVQSPVESIKVKLSCESSGYFSDLCDLVNTQEFEGMLVDSSQVSYMDGEILHFNIEPFRAKLAKLKRSYVIPIFMKAQVTVLIQLPHGGPLKRTDCEFVIMDESVHNPCMELVGRQFSVKSAGDTFGESVDYKEENMEVKMTNIELFLAAIGNFDSLVDIYSRNRLGLIVHPDRKWENIDKEYFISKMIFNVCRNGDQDMLIMVLNRIMTDPHLKNILWDRIAVFCNDLVTEDEFKEWTTPGFSASIKDYLMSTRPSILSGTYLKALASNFDQGAHESFIDASEKRRKESVMAED